MYGSLDISTSGMVAQRVRLAAISANIANQNTILDANGNVNPFRRREVHFAPGNPRAIDPSARSMGVHDAQIVANQDAVRLRYDPSSRFANEDGYVPTPDIDSVTENVNAMEAARAYEANVVAAEATKSMMAQALRLLA